MLEVKNLKKQYGQLKAVDGISFKVEAGRCFGLLGPNGAGKTTAIEILEGVIEATSGEILYKGKARDNTYKEEVGIMFQSTALQDFVTVKELLEMFSKLYKKVIPPETLIEKCGLQDFLHQNNRKISGGQKQRLLLAIALINNPDIIFLDEPTTGLDPQARRNLWAVVNEIKASGKTIIMTTHYMEEASNLCDEIAIMDKGKIIAHGEPETLLKKHFDESVIELPAEDFKSGEALKLNQVTIKDTVQIHTNQVTETIQQLLASNVSLERMVLRAKNLEDLFIELTGQALRE